MDHNDLIETEVEIIDLEEYSAQGKQPPKAKRYRVRVNKIVVVFDISDPTREQILERAGLTPVSNWSLRIKTKQGYRLIADGEHVDLTAPGVEKFKALPRDQTEG
ncbi:MAG: multiubiquitin domain-containing protein [Chloroflexi bacterium]|nr:multiubiquitin domain-containing protein [Chloroflexota bacterium]